MKKAAIYSVLFIILAGSSLWGQSNLPLHLKIMQLSTVEEPQIWNGMIFLTARPEKSVRFIGVAFDYESYNTIHPFQINEKGIYVFTAPVPEREEIKYRLIMDGLWMADPLGRRNGKDSFGIEVSRLTIPLQSYIKVTGPSSDASGKTVFSLRSRPDATVSIVGTFNGWDPYMTPMAETSSGVYSTEMKLREGSYFYYFIVDGKKAMDPQNFLRARNTEGEEVCRIDIDRS
ncbi:MAG: hypothetical protein JXR86_14310 [Spirochaetales bacterium]|nr:hypothetical protein [Spirochaetales bacterium]